MFRQKRNECSVFYFTQNKNSDDACVGACVSVCVCVGGGTCVCVWVRAGACVRVCACVLVCERPRDRDSERGLTNTNHLMQTSPWRLGR